MKNVYEELNKYLSSIHMGTKIFRVYKDKAEDQELIDVIDEMIACFKKHEENLNKLILSGNEKPNTELPLGKEFIVWMEKMKSPSSDFEIAIYSIKGINMGIIGSLEFLNKNEDLNSLDKDIIIDVIDDYEDIYQDLKRFILKKYTK